MKDKEPQNKIRSEQKDQENLSNIFYKYSRYWYLFLLGLIFALGAAFLYIRFSTPYYLVSGTLLVKTNENETELTENAAFSDLSTFKSSRNFDNEIEVLLSYRLMLKVLKELAINESYFIEAPFSTRELYGKDLPVKVASKRLKPDASGRDFVLIIKDNEHYVLEEEGKSSTHRFGATIQRPYGTFAVVKSNTNSLPISAFKQNRIRVVFENINSLAQDYSESLQVEPINTNASVLNISITNSVPERGRDIINKLMEVYREEALEEKNLIASSTIRLIDDRLKNLSAEIKNIENNIEQFKRQNKVTDVANQSEVYVEEATAYQKQLAEWSIQFQVLETIEKYLSGNKENNYRLVPSTLSIQDPTLQSLVSKFNELQLDREKMLRSTERMNPFVQNMDHQLQNLRSNILENIKNIKNGLIITRRSLIARNEQTDSKVNSMPSLERDLVEIARQRVIKQEQYKYLLEKREESMLALVSTVSNSLVLKPAIADSIPVEPKQQTILVLALIFGFGLPLASIYLKNHLNRQVQRRSDVEKITATPIIGEISYKDSNDFIVVSETSSTSIAELFRLIRTNLQFELQEKENNIILVTSSVSGEGKTFFSLNLGASLGLTGKKVVVLDFDLRKPGMLANVGLENKYGITDYLKSDVLPVEEIINPFHQVPNLFIAGAGTPTLSPAELMTSKRVEQLIQDLQEEFDYIIMDTAPVGQVSDAFNLAKFSDITLCLVRYNYTLKDDVEFIDDIYVNEKFPQPMIVLNGAKKFNSYKYGYVYGYGKKKKMQLFG